VYYEASSITPSPAIIAAFTPPMGAMRPLGCTAINTGVVIARPSLGYCLAWFTLPPSDGRAYNFCCGDLWRRWQPLRAFPLGAPSNQAPLASEDQLQLFRLHLISRPYLIILNHHSSSTSHGTMRSRNAGNLIGLRSESLSKVRYGRRACCA
jgi:hypothetical protein